MEQDLLPGIVISKKYVWYWKVGVICFMPSKKDVKLN